MDFKLALYLLIIFMIKSSLTKTILHASPSNTLKFYEEPSDTYLTKTQPAILKCKIENARTGFFKCNDHWSQDPTNSRIVQIGNTQILSIEHAITRSQLEDYRKSVLSANSESIPSFWCTCQGWLNSADDTIISQKAYVKLSYLHQNFEWEPMPTSGLIGKSVEIRCLPPDGEPKPALYWLRNGQPIEKSNKRVLVSHEGSLLINEVRISDSGNYTCVAENLAGKRFSDPAQLTVSENKGWGEWSNWTECSSLSSINCGEGAQKRYRTCQNPPTINNAIGCDGFPSQTITCYIPCNSASLLIDNVQDRQLNDVLIDSKPIISQYSSQYTTNEIGYWWTQWSSWSMVCNADCMRSRRRECKPGYLSSSGKLIPVADEKLDPIVKIKKCAGLDVEYSNCTFYCEKISNSFPSLNTEREFSFPTLYVLALVLVVILISMILIVISTIKRKRKKNLSKKRQDKAIKQANDHHHPIYYSVQPDYTQDTFMDACTLLPSHTNTHLNPKMYGYDLGNKSKYLANVNSRAHNGTLQCTNYLNTNHLGCNLNCNTSNSIDDHCNASRNSTTTTASGSNSTTSSKIKLNSSPTDSLVKSVNTNSCMLENSAHNYACCSTINKTFQYSNAVDTRSMMQLGIDNENNAFQIMKLINEQKTCVYQAKSVKLTSEFNVSSLDMYAFNMFKSGGIIEIPKYSIHVLVPDDTFLSDISAGILRSNNENLLDLKDDQTLLSSIFVVKSDYATHSYTKPIIISMDHSALFAETDWNTAIYYKSFTSNYFEEIDEKVETILYSQIMSNRCYIMTEKDGMYALVGRPNTTGSSGQPCIKEMKYAILLVDGEIKIYLIQNTKSANEILNEQIQKTNGKIIKMPETFELNYPKRGKLENSYLNLELNIAYNNTVINSDSTCRRIRMSDIWNSSCDFIEIQIPFSLNGQAAGKQLKNSLNYKLANQSLAEFSRINFDLKVSFELEDKLLFSYSNLNTNTFELHTASCNQQEFYSSVSVNPVFIPLKITNLLDEYVLRCFKMNTLKRNDWRLFANFLKFDKNVQYFATKENSFELILSLWLMINLSRSNSDDSFTVNLNTINS